MKYGDRYLDSLQEGIKKVQSLEVFNFCDNRMTPRVSGDMILASKNAKELNLSRNRIGEVGVLNLMK